MGRNEKIATEYAKGLAEWAKECIEKDDMSTELICKLYNKQTLETSVFMLARIADALEELNEKLNKKPDGGYVVYGDNLRAVHYGTGTGDCK